MLHFYGFQKEYEGIVFRSYNDKVSRLPLYLDPTKKHGVNHSPTGFAWGYHGSGPSQLAYAILRTYFATRHSSEEAHRLAQMYYMDFKDSVVSRFDKDHWRLSQDEIDIWFKIRLTDSTYYSIIELH